jgi:hypothetical protein
MRTHVSATLIWCELAMPAVMWICYIAGLLYAPNPVFEIMRGVAQQTVAGVLALAAALLVLPGLATVTALTRFNQARRHSHAHEANRRLFGGGVLAAVMFVWGIMLFIAPQW